MLCCVSPLANGAPGSLFSLARFLDQHPRTPNAQHVRTLVANTVTQVPDSLILPWADKLEHTADRIRYIIMTLALACWGVYQGVWNTATETIFADSVKAGDRWVLQEAEEGECEGG